MLAGAVPGGGGGNVFKQTPDLLEPDPTKRQPVFSHIAAGTARVGILAAVWGRGSNGSGCCLGTLVVVQFRARRGFPAPQGGGEEISPLQTVSRAILWGPVCITWPRGLPGAPENPG